MTRPGRAAGVTQRGLAMSGNGTVHIRRIRPSDETELLRFYAGLSSESRRRRFFSLSAGVSAAQSAAFCRTDHTHGEGFVAVLTSASTSEQRIVGHLCLEPDGAATAELAIVVTDEFQHHGVGTRLLAVGARWAVREHVDHLTATTLATNGPMQRLLGGLGRPMHVQWDGVGLTTVAIDPVASPIPAIRPSGEGPTDQSNSRRGTYARLGPSTMLATDELNEQQSARTES